jgi:hypothetical protein
MRHGNVRHATCNRRHAARATDKQHAPCSGRHATRNKQRATGNMRQTSSNMQRATTACNAADTMQPGNGQRAACNGNPVLCRQRGKDSRRRAPGNKHATKQEATRQHASCSRQRATGSMQQTTCSRQQTACKRTRAHAKCNRKHTALPHFVCGGQREAHKQQHARSIVLDNQCATRHRRHTHDATHDPCRSMHQTQTEPTTRSRQCNVRDETNEIRTLAHLGARCAGGGGVGWSVGLGLPESDCHSRVVQLAKLGIRTAEPDSAKSDVPNSQDQSGMRGERD